MNVIDLFSGAGGLYEGFAEIGFQAIAFLEKEYWACQTIETRLCFNWLKRQNDLDVYHRYCMESTSSTIEHDRKRIIYTKYPELEKYVSGIILNKTLGEPQLNNKVVDSSKAIALIEHCMRRQNITQADVVVGGPPCQAYSLIGRSRIGKTVEKDSRNYLFRYYLDIVSYFRPNLFVFENVPGLLSAGQGKILDCIMEEFNTIGFTLLFSNGNEDTLIHNVSDYGVNQKRKRLIILGYNNDFWMTPEYPDFKKYAICFDEAQTTYNTIGDLPELDAGVGNDFWFGNYPKSPSKLSLFEQTMRTDSAGVQNHKARPHRMDDLEIYSIARSMSLEGERLQYSSLPDHLRHHRNGNTNKFQDRFCVHGLHDMSHTVVAHLSKDGHYNIHPTQNRSLTVREAARIQSFPDTFRFEGPRTSQFLQVGNAVPPLFARAIAASLFDILKERCARKNV